MPSFDTTHIIVIILTAFIASGIASAIGFALGLIMVSFLQFFLPPIQIVGLIFIIGTANATMRTVETRRIKTDGISWRMIIAGALAMPLGSVVIRYADPLFLKRFFSSIILAAAVFLVIAQRKSPTDGHANGRLSSALQLALGAIGGFVGSAAGLPGPPLVLCALIQHWPKMITHAVFSRFFLVGGILGGSVLFALGGYQNKTIILGLCLIPVVALGVVTGTWLRNRISQQQFRRCTMIGLIFLALGGFINTFFLTP